MGDSSQRGRVSSGKDLLYLAFQLSGVTGLCNQITGRLHDRPDPTPLVSPALSRSSPALTLTLVCHSKTSPRGHSRVLPPLVSHPDPPLPVTLLAHLLFCHAWTRPFCFHSTAPPLPQSPPTLKQSSPFPSGSPLPPGPAPTRHGSAPPGRPPRICQSDASTRRASPPSCRAPPLGPACFPCPGAPGSYGALDLTQWGFRRSGVEAGAGAGSRRRLDPGAGPGVGLRRPCSAAPRTSPRCSATASCTGARWRSREVRPGPGGSGRGR